MFEIVIRLLEIPENMSETELYNEDELVAPKWMDKPFFEKVLRDAHKDKDISVNITKKSLKILE